MIKILLIIVIATKFVDCRPYVELFKIKACHEKFLACQKCENVKKIEN
jgi:hypothetical protein